MRKLQLGLAGALIGLAAVAVAVAACGTDETRGAVCALDSDCHANELCHPQARLCVGLCRSAESCEEEARDCQPLSEEDARTVCKCSEEAQCQGERLGSSGTCSASLQVCVTRCGEEGTCPEGQTCDTATNECRGAGGSAPP
jgi:hypothetical protein